MNFELAKRSVQPCNLESHTRIDQPDWLFANLLETDSDRRFRIDMLHYFVGDGVQLSL